MSIQQWQTAIGITRTEQTTVRQILAESGVLEEMLVGRPAVMHYRLNVGALASALARSSESSAPSWDTVSGWFRGYHNYYKPLADIAGSIGAGLYLSLLLQRHRAALVRGQLANGCIEVSQDEIGDALCLGPKVQRNARTRLKKAGLIQEAGAAGVLIRVNLDAVLMCLRGQTIKPLKGIARQSAPAAEAPMHLAVVQPVPNPPEEKGTAAVDLSALAATFRQLPLGIQDRSRPATASRPRDLFMSILTSGDLPEVVGFRQVASTDGHAHHDTLQREKSKRDRHLLWQLTASLEEPAKSAKNAVSCKLESPRIAETCNQGLPFPATHIQGGSIQTTTTGSSSGSESDTSRVELSNGLVFPESLTTAQVASIHQLLERVPVADRQFVLDELSGRMRGHSPLKSPVGWLSGLIKRMDDGPVVFAYADEVAMTRRMQARLQRRADPSSPPPIAPEMRAEPVDPAVAARIAAQRAKARALADEMRGARFNGRAK